MPSVDFDTVQKSVIKHGSNDCKNLKKCKKLQRQSNPRKKTPNKS